MWRLLCTHLSFQANGSNNCARQSTKALQRRQAASALQRRGAAGQADEERADWPNLSPTTQTVLLCYCRGAKKAGCLTTCDAAAVEAQPLGGTTFFLGAAVQRLKLCCLAAADESHGWLVNAEEGPPEPPVSQPNSKPASPERAQPLALSPDKQQQPKQEQPDEEQLDEDRPLLFALNSFRRRRDSLNIRYSTSTYYDGQLYTPA